MRLFLLRSLLYLSLWTPAVFWTARYAEEEFHQRRFESLVLTNGRVASVQREMVFKKEKSVRPGDRIVQVGGKDFDWLKVKEWISQMPSGIMMDVDVIRFEGSLDKAQVLLRSYSKRDILVLFILPTLLSIIFLGFSVFTPAQRFSDRKNQEALEVFSVLCFFVSLFFLGFFPSVTLAIAYPSSLLLPLMGASLVHLFLVYPKKKGQKTARNLSVIGIYGLAATVVGFRVVSWFSLQEWWASLLEVFAFGLCGMAALSLLGNTLFTSTDFWTRRRARLLSFGFLFSFVAVISIFFSLIWEGPRVSLERLLGVSLLFPMMFAFVFSKENVFDIERLFKRGLHQVLFLGIAIVLAVLVGISLQTWADTSEMDWLVWSTIAMVVALFARPMGLIFEQVIRKLGGTKVHFPDIDQVLSQASSSEEFMNEVCRSLDRKLNMKSITLRFFKDPLKDWSTNNEQIWKYEKTEIHRVFRSRASMDYRRTLMSGERYVGEIQFSGGDALGFDPLSSASFNDFCRKLSRCLELLVYREYLLSQQGLLAVGRMQALLAHELKNPLAVIKVCAGLLPEYLNESDEAEEILKTIQEEITRVSAAVQGIFNHSGRDERQSRFDLYELIENAKAEVKARFPKVELKASFVENSKNQAWEKDCLWISTQREGFRQCLTNLMVNAIESGSPWVEVRVEIKGSKAFSVSVEDAGPGIPQDIELFKPFVTTKATGTGLGLSHVKDFVDRQSGRIQVFSPRSGGAKFVMEFSPHFVEKREERRWRK